MKKFILPVIFSILMPILVAAQCESGRYRDFIFQNYSVQSDLLYGSNINQDGASEDLLLDVYEPEGDADTDRALVILCHGGYFIGGDKAEVDMAPLCQDLARMGYVVASINYRMGIPFSFNLEVPYGQAVVRAVQDLRAAIRWFRKDVAENGNQFGIDPEEIYTGGSSAGGFMSLHLAYMDESEVPTWLDMTIPGLEGGLEGESGNAGYSSDVKAIFSVSGALGDSDWIDAEDNTPALLFHGDDDNVITIDSGLFVLFNTIDVTTVEGSNYINERLDNFGIEHCYEINEGMGHVPYVDDAAIYDTTLSIISNFLSHYICGVELDCSYREIIASVEEKTLTESVVFPNPTTGLCYLSKVSPDIKKISVSDMSGKLLRHQNFQQNGEVDLRDLSPGIYVVGLHGGKLDQHLKVIVN